jgi:hypothetical protein
LFFHFPWRDRVDRVGCHPHTVHVISHHPEQAAWTVFHYEGVGDEFAPLILLVQLQHPPNIGPLVVGQWPPPQALGQRSHHPC